MMLSTRKEILESVIAAIGEYNSTAKGQIEQLYSCRAWVFMPDNLSKKLRFYNHSKSFDYCSGFSAFNRHFVGVRLLFQHNRATHCKVSELAAI